jgi:hypothetical protein
MESESGVLAAGTIVLVWHAAVVRPATKSRNCLAWRAILSALRASG